MILAGRAARRRGKRKRASVLGQPMNGWMNGGNERRKKEKKVKKKRKKHLVLPTGSRVPVFLFFCLLEYLLRKGERRKGLEYHQLQGCMSNTGTLSNTWSSPAPRQICCGKTCFSIFFSIFFKKAERSDF